MQREVVSANAASAAEVAMAARRERIARERRVLSGRLREVREAPVFRPTAEQFRDPFAYIRSIRDEAAKYGICKIIPPAEKWRPPYIVGASSVRPSAVEDDEESDTNDDKVEVESKDEDKAARGRPGPSVAEGDESTALNFETRLQALHQLKHRSGANEEFTERLRMFLEARQGEKAPSDPSGSAPLGRRARPYELPPRIAMPGAGHGFKREVDLLMLYKLVEELGGYYAVTDNRLWSSVAREMHFNDPNSGSALRGVYERFLKEFAENETLNEALKETQAPPKRPKLENGSGRQKVNQPKPGSRGSAGDSLRNAAGEALCSACASGKMENQILLCDKCNDAYHISCLDPPLTTVPPASEPWYCDQCDQKRDVNFGFSEGESFPLPRFEQFANAFKADWLADFYRDSKHPSPLDIEAEYWRVVDSGEEAVHVRYGSDLDTKVVGSGFPNPKPWSKHAMRLPEGVDEERFEEYLRNPWNLNIFPELDASLLDCLGSGIKGVSVPWLYFGMLFSSFCWHTEDSYMYSINYMHFGQGKIWYGSPGGMGAAKFEAAFRATVPELFDAQPDLLFHLVTMIGPHDLMDRGAQICRAIQMPGEFIITFPQAYHGGFSLGFNCAEAVNFATVDWLPFARACAERHRMHQRPPIFSLDELVFRTIRSPFFGIKTSRWEAMLLLADLKVVIERERNIRTSLEKATGKKPHHTDRVTGCGTCMHCRQPCYLSAVLHRGTKMLCPKDFESLLSRSLGSTVVQEVEDNDTEENSGEADDRRKRRRYRFPTEPAKITLIYCVSEAQFAEALTEVRKIIDSNPA